MSRKPKKTPLMVRWDGDHWLVTVGNSTQAIERFNRKHLATGYAENKAIRAKRPGAVVEERDGSYQKFIENEAYWKRGYWEA